MEDVDPSLNIGNNKNVRIRELSLIEISERDIGDPPDCSARLNFFTSNFPN